MDFQTYYALKAADPGSGITAYGCFLLHVLARKLLEGKTNMDFVHSHEGLQAHNIFVDEDFNVTG